MVENEVIIIDFSEFERSRIVQFDLYLDPGFYILESIVSDHEVPKSNIHVFFFDEALGTFDNEIDQLEFCVEVGGNCKFGMILQTSEETESWNLLCLTICRFS